MLPIITEEAKESIINEISQDVNSWRKKMVHYIKEENPEINAAIIDMYTKHSIDPKGVALGAYMVYKMIELSSSEQSADS